MKTPLLIIILCFPLLTGCGIFKFFEKSLPPIVPPNQVVELDPRVLEPCIRSLTTLSSTSASFEELLINKAEDIKIHDACVSKQDASIALLKKFSNKE